MPSLTSSRAVSAIGRDEFGEAAIAPGSAIPEGGEAGSSGSIFRLIGRVFIENKLAVVGLIILVLIFGFCFLGPFFYHSNQGSTGVSLNINLPPGPGHPLGTDLNGYDLLGRLMLAGQASLTVGLAAAGVATLIGVVWGAVAGFFGGVLDAVMMRFVDIALSIPGLLLLIVIDVIFTPDKTLLIFIIASLAWLTPARLVRGETLTLRTREYVQAVRVMGGNGRRIVLRHIIPNAIGTIVVNATFQVADAILTLAALSFLGLGIQAPQTDWGSMLNDGTSSGGLLNGYWWEIVPASVAIVLVVVAFNFIGDALRDSLEVRLQQR
ncbi:MAG: ABC transporter permease [Acidimicrobiales bacterium]